MESYESSSGSSAPSSNIILESKTAINEEEFYSLANTQEIILKEKYSKYKNDENNENKDINELFSNIFKDFYAMQEKLLSYKLEKIEKIEKEEGNNIINDIKNDDDDEKENEDKKEKEDNDLSEGVNIILKEIFFESPFDEYTNKFYSVCKNLSKQYLTKNILNEKQNMTFVDYLEKEIFKTKLPNFLKNLLILVITEKEKPEKERYLMNPEEKRKYDEKIKINERQEKNIKMEDWNLEKILNLLDSEKEKERLKPILKEMEDDLKPKPALFIRNEEDCKKAFEENKAKFNIIAMNKYYLDMDQITICISGFLTEKQEHFSGWKEFVRNNKQVTFYYFLNWPSESKLTSFMYFTQAKKRANYFGKILANMIVSEKFFKNKKITLVGHSLGCHFIKCCIKEMAENKDEDFKVDNKIEKIIFLGGATQIKNKKRWEDIFKKVTKGNIYNFYSKKDGALKIMQTRLVWGKKPIGRNPLLITGIDVHNFDCGNIEFEDFLNHSYKEVYGKLVEHFNL